MSHLEDQLASIQALADEAIEAPYERAQEALVDIHTTVTQELQRLQRIREAKPESWHNEISYDWGGAAGEPPA